ncbi:MAG: ion transporter [Elusimicrobia bacterium]|nr:ion transporter [Elusimicrobiota bacterium]
MKGFRRRAYEIVEASSVDDRASWCFKTGIIALIGVSALSVVLETVPSLFARFGREFLLFETATVLLFSAEYVVRLWACVEDPRYRRPILGRLKYVLSPMALIDLAAVLPFYLPLVSPVDFRVLRALRLVRLARLFELGGYGDTVETVSAVVHDKKEELVVTTCIAVVMLVVISSLVYFVEHPAQPDKFSSIPAALWWGIATMTTVGYGDIFPVTTLGKVLAGLGAIAGMGLFALPAGILGSGFVEEMHRRHARAAPKKCPHCGKNV